MPEKGHIYYEHHRGASSPEGRAPLVLIHGAGGTHLHWPPELRRMSGEIVCSLDLPGHGRSGGSPAKTIRGYAQSLVEWLDQLESEPVVLIGHSMGGAISMTLALDVPQRVHGLVLVGTGARLRVNPQILALTENEAMYPQAAELVTQWAFSEHADERMLELAQKRMAEVPARVVHADFVACDHFDVMERLREISTPTLVICGALDQLTPVKYSQYLAEHLPHASLAIVEDAGHMAMLERPVETARHVHDFLLGLSS
jgi:pimeloyl-ACP methyl ester carboxylesterase